MTVLLAGMGSGGLDFDGGFGIDSGYHISGHMWTVILRPEGGGEALKVVQHIVIYSQHLPDYHKARRKGRIV